MDGFQQRHPGASPDWSNDMTDHTTDPTPPAAPRPEALDLTRRLVDAAMSYQASGLLPEGPSESQADALNGARDDMVAALGWASAPPPVPVITEAMVEAGAEATDLASSSHHAPS